jgi:molybdopterin-guanine dinucleotide biosynthesis protein A
MGRPVLVVPVDLPLIDAATLQALLRADRTGVAAVVPRAHGRLQPLCALYCPAALAGLEAFDVTARAIDVVTALGIRELDGLDPMAFFNVNRPEDVLQASVHVKGAGG